MPGSIAANPKPCWKPTVFCYAGVITAHGDVSDSVLIEPVHIEKGAVVRNTILGPNVSVAAGSVIDREHRARQHRQCRLVRCAP
jgi:ADP-glucose pyrophosphorylase